MRPRKGMTLIEVMIVIVIILIIASIAVGINTSPGTGEKIGQIVKLEKKGMIWKTWEAQLIRGGMNDGSGSFGTVPFDFTIEDSAAAAAINDHMRKQSEVVIKYRVEGLYKPTRSENGGRFLVSVEPIKPDSNSVGK